MVTVTYETKTSSGEYRVGLRDINGGWNQMNVYNRQTGLYSTKGGTFFSNRRGFLLGGGRLGDYSKGDLAKRLGCRIEEAKKLVAIEKRVLDKLGLK